MTINAHPLSWPVGWKRTEAAYRTRASFSRARKHIGQGYVPARALTISEGVERVADELRRMGVVRDDWVISSNVKLRLDGLPRSDQAEPTDPGVACYWEDAFGARKVMAIDLYDRVADNLAAIAATLDAMRAIERHGGAAILERAFTGFTALPAPGAKRTYWEVMGLHHDATHAEVKARYRELAGKYHPDRHGGDPEKMAELNQAMAEADEQATRSTR